MDIPPTNVEILLNCLVSKDDLFLSWASLLRRYADDDVICFEANGSAVTVDASDSTIEHTLLPENLSRNFTSVFSLGSLERRSREGSNSPALRLTFDLERGTGALHSNGAVPPSYLTNIRDLFLLELRKRSKERAGQKSEGEESAFELSVSNPTPTIMEGPALLHDLALRHRLEREIAIDFLDASGRRTKVSYSQLRLQSLAVARSVCRNLCTRRMPTHPAPIVPVLLPQSVELYPALLGVLQSGCAYCPINLDTPDERLRFILRDVGAEVVVTSAEQAGRVKTLAGIECSLIESVLKEANTTTDSGRFRIADPHDPAYVMYSKQSFMHPPVFSTHQIQSFRFDRHPQRRCALSFRCYTVFAGARTRDTTIFAILAIRSRDF